MSKNVAWVSGNETQQVQEQSAQYSGGGDMSGYSALIQPTMISHNWLESEIGEIAEVIGGGTPKSSEADNFAEPGTGIAWLTPADLSGYSNQYILHGARDLSKKGYQSSSAKIMPKGSLLFSSRAPIGYVAIAANEISTNQGFKSFVFSKEIDPKFAYFYLKSIRDLAESRGTGTTFKELSGANTKKLPFIIAPIAEQQQIAAKLDELLAQVDSIKTRLDAIPKILKRFRQSVLAAAVSGKLTEDWREDNLCTKFSPNSVELTEFRGKELPLLPKNWQWLKFDQVASVASNLYDPSLAPEAFHIAPNHIESGTGKLLEYTTVSEDKVISSKHRFYAGQILYSKIRPYLCKVTIVNFTGLCSADMYPVNSNINTQFLFRWMLSSQFTDWASSAESRSVLPKINQKDLGMIPVPTPPIQEQNEIVNRVEQFFAYADQIEQRVKDAQARVNHLTQSILAKAFRGELTAEWRAQNPDLISGENSAEALLAKIHKERE